jgi:putative peptidoglycan lipid II flippase
MTSMSKGIARAAVIIMIMNLMSRVLGFVRETVIAKQFGATVLTDAYLVAYTLPYFLQAVLGMALVTSIVPVVTKYLVKGEEQEAWKIASITLNWTALLMAFFTLLGIVGARGLVYLTAPGFDASTTDLAVTLTIIMFPSIIFMGIGMLMTGILNARKSFAVAAFAPGFSSLVIILSVIFFGKYGIELLAWGTFLSMVGAMLIQVPVLRKAGFRYSWSWNLRHPEVKGIFINLVPIFLGVAVNQLYLAINRFFASGLAEGSISALNYASKLMNLPLGIFVFAISSAIFPTLSEQAIREDRHSLAVTLVRGLKMVLLITLPAAAGLMALKTPIVKLLFERGAFDATATKMTADALFYFCVGMFAMAANMVITRAYYALRDVNTPLYMGLFSIVVNIIASVLLVKNMGHSGLALANTLAAAFNTVAMYIFLRKHLPNLLVKDLLATVLKSLVSSLLTALAAWKLYVYLQAAVGTGGGTKVLLGEVFLSIFLGMAVYGLTILLLREREMLYILNTFLNKLGIRFSLLENAKRI